jgi:hypothetical protein
LSIRELDDGRVLLHAFCGCSTEAVLSAVGLTLSDLFPERLSDVRYATARARMPARELLEIIDFEVAVAAIILADVLEARATDEAQWSRLAQAAARIGLAREHARG